MFRSKLGALVFVAGVLFAAYRMVGTEENGGELTAAADRIAEQRDNLQGQAQHANTPNSWEESDLQDGDWGSNTEGSM